MGPGSAAPAPDPLALLAQAKALAGANPELLAILTQLEAMLVPPPMPTGMEELMAPGLGGMF